MGKCCFYGASRCCCLRWGAGALLLLCAAAGAYGEAAQGWPEFRGPWANGWASRPGTPESTGLPLTWSETENITWKTAIPHQGWSTPVVLEGRVWLTTATPEGNDFFVLGLDAKTGAVLTERKLFHCDTPEPLGNNINCYASPSPVAEPGRVYVHFGSYGTACLDAATGNTLWERTDLPCRHYRGPGSSLFLYENLLVLTFDGADLQYTAALDKQTGKTVWKTDRSTVWTDLDEQGQIKREGDFRKAFSTPIVVDAPTGPEMLSLGSMAAFAYDPRTGQELWRAHNPGYTSAARPVFGDGLMYFVIGRGKPELWAMRPGGRGDVGETQLAWKAEGGIVPQEPSPIYAEGLLYILSNNGEATCLDATNGQEIWRQRLGGQFMASPVYADGRLYYCSVQGKTSVVKAGRDYELLAENRLEAGFMASPAVAGKAFFLRTKTHLYRIETPGTN